MKLNRGYLCILLSIALSSCGSQKENNNKDGNGPLTLKITQAEQSGEIRIYKVGDENKPLLVQEVKEDFRPYIHPIQAPDGKGILTEYSPGHHRHQTGLYWGFTRVNGRDYFHNPQGDYWRKVAANIVESEGETVKWQTIYQMLNEAGEPLMEETQNWSLTVKDGRYYLDLEWKGQAIEDITIGKYDYGGLFLRMPWTEGIDGEVVNAARQKNDNAEGQPAMWVNVGMQVEGREDRANVAIFDHPDNKGYPQKWRVDGQLGVGPAYTRDEDWEIKAGENLLLKHQLLIYTGTANDVEITKSWENFAGTSGMYSTTALWRIAQEEGRQAKFLTPQEAVEAMTIKEGYKVNVFAGEPMITQPMAFCWDDKGRLWVAENRDYESRGHGFSNAGDSRILILEDTNGDGEADSKKVFMEGLAFPAAIAVGFDGLFVGAPPNLLFVPDRDGDDRADMDDIEILLTGWGIRDRHETLNSLHWGPDGWLYGLQGFATPSKIRKPEGNGKLYFHQDPFPEDLLEADGVDINGGVWRYHPVKDRFEVVAHGFSNPWGIDYDTKGQLFMTACVIPHLWHVVPGGTYHRQGGQHFNPFVYEDIKTITDHSHRSAHGGARIYQSDAFPEEEHGKLFMANIHEHAVLSDILEPQGSGFIGRHSDDFLMANNAQWVGFSMEIGPEGGLYVLDWHDADICGQEVLHGETGRVFRIMPEKTQAENWKGRYEDLNQLTDSELIALQTSPSDWHARRARGILQKRAAKGKLDDKSHDELMRMFKTTRNPDHRLKAMWALHMTDGFQTNDLLAALSDTDPYIRSWAIQLFCEDKDPPASALNKFREMAVKDKSPVVRLYLAAAIQRIPTNHKWEISQALLQHQEDQDDHNLPKMIWFGLEPLIDDQPERFMEMAASSKIPFVTRFMARRAVDGDHMGSLVAQLDKSDKNRVTILEGMLSGMEGRTDLKMPESWKKTEEKLLASPQSRDLTLAISELFGDVEATQRAFANLENKSLSLDLRKKALQTLASQQRHDLIGKLPLLLEDQGLRLEAIRAVAAFDQDNLGRTLIEKYPTFNPEEKTEAVLALSSRPRYGNMLTREIREGRIPKREIPANVARQLLRVVGSGFVEVWGPIEQVPHDEAAYEKYRNILTAESLAAADLKAGKALFRQSCGSCHKMFGEGGDLGPDLTGSNRTDVDYILLNVLEPSAEIQDDYKMVVITTRDGRTYTGNIIAENQRQVTLRVVGQDPIIINKSGIQNREITPVSMMPPGLFEHLSEKEIVNLVGYLQTQRKIN